MGDIYWGRLRVGKKEQQQLAHRAQGAHLRAGFIIVGDPSLRKAVSACMILHRIVCMLEKICTFTCSKWSITMWLFYNLNCTSSNMKKTAYMWPKECRRFPFVGNCWNFQSHMHLLTSIPSSTLLGRLQGPHEHPWGVPLVWAEVRLSEVWDEGLWSSFRAGFGRSHASNCCS